MPHFCTLRDSGLCFWIQTTRSIHRDWKFWTTCFNPLELTLLLITTSGAARTFQNQMSKRERHTVLGVKTPAALPACSNAKCIDGGAEHPPPVVTPPRAVQARSVQSSPLVCISRTVHSSVYLPAIAPPSHPPNSMYVCTHL